MTNEYIEVKNSNNQDVLINIDRIDSVVQSYDGSHEYVTIHTTANKIKVCMTYKSFIKKFF